MPTAWNVFRIGRRARDEDQLTEMLVWLSDAVPAVRRALLELAFGDSAPAAEGVEVRTQYAIAVGRLDALLWSEQLAVVVESKLDSVYADDQLERYLKWLAAEHNDRPMRALVTLTARPARWRDSDVALAGAEGIGAAQRLWEDLHELLAPVAEGDADDALRTRLVREFLEMLAEEGLIPMQPLSEEERHGHAWSDAWRVVRRYRDFFRACTTAIGEALAAQPTSKSDQAHWTWQDYAFDDGARVVVGLYCTDEEEKIPSAAKTRAPLVWMAVKADHLSNWPQVAKRLEATPPEGWRTGSRWYGERPNVWRPLATILSGGTFEQQRAELASAVAVCRSWIHGAIGLSSAASQPDADLPLPPDD